MQSLTRSYSSILEPALTAPVNMRCSYDRYYATGLYGARYPVPNTHVLNLTLKELGEAGGRVLDFGCGNGRYALALAQHANVDVFAYDISAQAIQELSRRYNEMTEAGVTRSPIETLCGSFEELEARLEGQTGFDVIALLFGVLGHIQTRQRRVAVLRSLRARLRPGGRLIATVPNRARRFLAEQQSAQGMVEHGDLEPGDIYYQRRASDEAIELYYHLYSPAEFRSELEEAGFAVGRLQPESVLTERAVLSSCVGSVVDGVLRRVTPIALAYGMIAVTRPAE